MFLIHRLIELYVLVVFVRIIFSWFPMGPGSPLAAVNTFLYRATEPVLGPVRRAVPPMRMGTMGLDMSPLIVLFGLEILDRLLPW